MATATVFLVSAVVVASPSGLPWASGRSERQERRYDGERTWFSFVRIIQICYL